MAKRECWEVSDAFWAKVEPLVPVPQRDARKPYQRRPGSGRKPLPARQVFAGIVYGLRTGIQWKALPKERFGSPSAIHRYFRRWSAQGFFWPSGKPGWRSMRTWKGLPGNGKRSMGR